MYADPSLSRKWADLRFSLHTRGFAKYLPSPFADVSQDRVVHVLTFGQRRVSNDDDSMLPAILNCLVAPHPGVQLDLIDRWNRKASFPQAFKVLDVEVGNAN